MGAQDPRAGRRGPANADLYEQPLAGTSGRLRSAAKNADGGEQIIDRDEIPTWNTFTGLVIDRVTVRRRDEAWVGELSREPTTRFIPIAGSEVLVAEESPPRAILLNRQDAEGLLDQAESVVLLGETEERAYFAIGLTEDDGLPRPRAMEGAGFHHLRTVAALLERSEAGLLAYAKAMAYWHHRHQFCGDCGSATVSSQGGHLRVCTSEQCGQAQFPRTDPAIIVRVTRRNRCLLGRQPTWPEGLYSIIAGFVEPGESLEAAVVRELREETGVVVGQVRYHSSQPWPFPGSLMLGFTAEAMRGSIRLHDGELEDARWLSREEIVKELEQGTLQLPSDISISHRLIADWFDAGELGRLKDVLESG